MANKKPPGFVRNDTWNSLKEYQAFINASEDEAGHLLAELTRDQASGTVTEAQKDDERRTPLRGLYCRICDGWAAFYAVKRWPCQITIVLVGQLTATSPFSHLEAEAGKRRSGVVDGF